MVRGVSEPAGGTSRLEPLVTVAEAATFLGVQVGTVYLWAETERIPSYKIGALRRFRLSELEQHLRSCRNEASPPRESAPRCPGDGSVVGAMMPQGKA